MAKQTLKQRNLEFLKSRGWVEDPNPKTSKYLVLIKPGSEDKYFLGRMGAVRRGKNVTSSFSVKLRIALPPAEVKEVFNAIHGEPKIQVTPEQARRVEQIENKYSTEQGATEAERQEAQDIMAGNS